MAFKTEIPFGGGRQEAFFVNDGVIAKAELAYDVAPFPSWEGTENLVLRLEIEKEGLRWPQLITIYGSYRTEEVEKEVTKGRGKTKTTETVKVTKITGMGSAFRVTDFLREACESGQVQADIGINQDGEVEVDGKPLVPKEKSSFTSFDALVDSNVKVFYIRYKASRGKGNTGYSTHRRVMTYRDGEDDDAVIDRLRYDFTKQVRDGWIKDYLGEIPEEENGDSDDDKPPF